MQQAPSRVGSIEFTPAFRPRPNIQHVLFDFDGTLSLIRQGWPEIMIPMFQEMLPRQTGESEKQRWQLLEDDVMRLTGKQTIYQMMQFADRVRERGGTPQEPLWYKHEYLRRLHARIDHRIQQLAQSVVEPDRYLVHEARHLLQSLHQKGLTLHLASGTDEAFVRQEAQLLQIDHFFHERVYGARDDYQSFSKKMVIERILEHHRIQGEHLLAFGDGYVEIENTVEAGGLAVAVASDEANNGSGRMDPWKYKRLLGVGAQVIIPDFRDADLLLQSVFGSPNP